MTKIADIIRLLESFAPLNYQESYDNAGLITGDKTAEVKGILICLDSTEDIIDEAIRKGCNLIVAHHPIVFKGLKKITGKNYVERVMIKAIKNDIALYASHTNLDNVKDGVNFEIAKKIGLENIQILSNKPDTLKKLIVFVPKADADRVTMAINKAGAGQIGNYKNCSFSSIGTGSFEPNDTANPYIGQSGQLEKVEEVRVEFIYPQHREAAILDAMHQHHPYEEVAHFAQTTTNINQEIGAGAIGTLPSALDEASFLAMLKEKMNLKCIRHTALTSKAIKRVALCGGSGSFLLSSAIANGADAYISADFKYHEFFDAENKLVICDIGHYESESCTKDIFYKLLKENFTNIANIQKTEIDTNPVYYY